MNLLGPWQPTPLAIPQLIAAAVSLVGAGLMWRRGREARGGGWIALIMAAAGFWALCGALEFMAATLPTKILWSQIAYFGIALSPLALFHFTYLYVTEGGLPPRWLSAAVTAAALAVAVGAFTNASHGLHWPEIRVVERGPWVFAHYARGPLFWVTVTFCYSILVGSTVALARYTVRVDGLFRRNTWIIIAAAIAPWISSLTYVLRLGPLPELDHTPVGFAATGLLLGLAISRGRLFDLLPIAANTLFNRMRDPAIVVDPQQRIMQTNRAAMERLGLPTLVGQPLSDALGRRPRLLEALRTGTSDRVTVQDDTAWWDIESTLITDLAGGARGRLYVLREATAQKNAELDLRRTQAQLETALARADTLAREANAANHAKSTFLAQVSHDLRTPLHAIIGMSELLQGAADLPAPRRQEVGTIREAGEALLRLINDLLDLSRIEAGHLQLNPVPFVLDDVFDPVADLMTIAARRKGLLFLNWIEPGLPPTLHGDPDRLRQILLNLTGNAVKFTATGHVTLAARRSAPDRIEIAVSDTGPGIPAERLATLFEAFDRGDPALARQTEGTGLGLAITRRLATAMGGAVHVTSEPGRGSTFTLELPLTAAVAPPAPELHRRAVRIDEPNPAVRAALEHNLRSLGLVVRPADEPDTAPRLPTFRRDASSGSSPTSLDPIAYTLPLKRRRLAAALLDGSSPSAHPIAPSPPDLALATARQRVLLADDDRLSRLVSARLFARCGCQVTAVESGRAALEALPAAPFDLVVLDGQMADVAGWEVAQRLRDGACGDLNRTTPVVALTADLTAENAVRWRDAGARRLLGKPLRTDQLRTTLANLAGVLPADGTGI